MSSATVKAGRWFRQKVIDAIDVENLSVANAGEIETAIAEKTEIAALAAGPTMTYTTGSAPAVGGAVTIADSATPTVTELLDYIVELNAKVNAIVSALKA